MPLKKPRLEQSPRRILTAHAGLALIGEAIAASRLDQAVKSMGSYRGTDHGQVLSTYLGLLTLGKSDFEAAEGVRKDPFFLSCMGLKRGLSAARLRQRMDASAMDYARALDRANLTFLQQAKVPVTPLSCGHVVLDLDLFAQDNSGTHKEGVGYTYRGFDGYGVMPAYLGEEGWCLATELKPGSENSQNGFGFVLDRVLPAARSLTERPILMRLDSAHDALENRVRAQAEGIDFIIKWNPRQASAADWMAHADGLEGSKVKWETPREGKRIATFSVNETRSWQGQEYTFRRVMRVVERTIDRKGQALVFPDLEVEGWWTSLELSDDDIIALYRGHATCEQFHSEFKTDMDLERLPSGKFDTNTLVMAAGTFVYNVLRWIGLQGLIGDDSPVRHPAKRRRIRTVFQELISLPAQLVHHARQVWLRFGAHCPGFAAFKRVFTQLQACASG
ncbi:IS1380 family transposase [Ectothiorhodospira haloalkaliphila]|uniref:IS1380 family transposase n=1 Tax=Ectothiorhodospira haloalkaliphila TaxID=421628 RepID=UPI001EE96984|nr:IS1380 family transposase [Ectothiorhodospira haloalkaliphila]MCG5525875.1 IS1380 family transposase [Ectothiorhodospira haloalkaliphila]